MAKWRSRIPWIVALSAVVVALLAWESYRAEREKSAGVPEAVRRLAEQVESLEGQMGKMKQVVRAMIDLEPGPRRPNPAMIQALKGFKATTPKMRLLLIAVKPLYSEGHIVTEEEIRHVRSLALDALLEEN